MDVREANLPGLEHIDVNHWYYDAKYQLIKAFVTQQVAGLEGITVLDVGCGSGILLRQLAADCPNASWRFIGYDPYREQAPTWDDPRMRFTRTLDAAVHADVVLMIDVIEHVCNDHLFVRNLLADILRNQTRTRAQPLHVLATVPAHQYLWSRHDEFLGHTKRYALSELVAVFPQEVRPICRHYFYAAILPVVVPLRLLRRNAPLASDMRPARPLLNRLLKGLLRGERLLAPYNRLTGLTALYGGTIVKLADDARRPPRPPERLRGQVRIIVPAYREQRRLPRLLGQVAATAQAGLFPHHLTITIADDGSPKPESEAMQLQVENLRQQFPLLADRLEFRRFAVNHGKGYVLRSLFAETLTAGACETVGFLDADGSTPFTEILRGLELLEGADGLDVVIGSRIRCLGRTLGRRWQRHLSGRIFATIVGMLFGIPIYDSQCGAKLFRLRVLDQALLQLCADNRWLFDTQLLIALWTRGQTIHEMPVDWRETEGSKVSLLRDSTRMLVGLLKFRTAMARHRLRAP
jgi:SAM-dependent methyltransferase